MCIRDRDIAGVHVIATACVIGFASAHVANDRHLVHVLGHHRHVLTDLQVAVGRNWLERTTRTRTGFEIPDVDGRWAAAHPQQDRSFMVFLQSRGVGMKRLAHRDRTAGQRSGTGQVLHEVTSVHTGRGLKVHVRFPVV